MDEERLLIDYIEDFDDETILESTKYRLLVIEKNIANIKKNIKHHCHENLDTKQRIKICQNRISFIDDDLRLIESLKCNIEAKIAEFIEFVEDPDTLPVVYDPQLELFIDQKVENYTNHVAHYRALTEKKNKIFAYIQRLQNILEDHKKELIKHNEMVEKYNNWMPELRAKQVETSSEINAIEGDIVAFLDGNSSGVSRETSALIKERFDLMQDGLEHRMRTLMQLNGFSLHIQSECDKHRHAITDLDEKNSCLQDEINNTQVLLDDTDMEVQNVEMKYSKVEEQIYSYINIQETMNFVKKCEAYYELISTYEKEKENVQSILNTFQERNINEVLQISSWESSLSNWMEEKGQMEAHITTLVNAAK